MSGRVNGGNVTHRTVALMYHALFRNGGVPPPDRVYTLEATTFERQLDRIIEVHGTAGCVRDWLSGATDTRILLTFDDGRASDYDIAFAALRRRNMRADFFVNPANVGTRGYTGWNALREMSMAGMSIQSHGYEHRYFTHFHPHELRQSLYAARCVIEDKIGTSVTLLAPPGGRMPTGLVELARECGYQRIVSSRPGRVAHTSTSVLPRMAVTTRLAANEFDRWLAGDAISIWRHRLAYSGLAAAKRLLGDARYEKARSRALAGPEGG